MASNERSKFSEKKKVAILLIIWQLAIFVAFGFLAKYHDKADAANPEFNLNHEKNDIDRYASMFQDVHIMVYVGFGFLMTFLKRYGYSAVGFNLLIAALAAETAFCFKSSWTSSFKLHTTDLITSDFTAATVLISFGAVLGKLSILQLVLMTLFETIFIILNEWIGTHIFHAVDVGGSMFIHAFGAYFGLALAKVLYKPHQKHNVKETAGYNSNLFAMIGTLFLWICWPSFNAALAPGDDRQRAVINTYLSLLASTIATFILSYLLSEDDKLDMVHIQNATLAGGVAIGTSADMMTTPLGAVIVGTLGGAVSVIGYHKLMPMLLNKLKLHDTCGVHNLHGMPGIIGGLAGVVFSALANEESYKASLYQIFPIRAPLANATVSALSKEVQQALKEGLIEHGSGRSAMEQAGYQALALLVSLVIAVVGGIVVGFLLRAPIWNSVPDDKLFDDEHYWAFPQNELQAYSPLNVANETVQSADDAGELQEMKIKEVD